MMLLLEELELHVNSVVKLDPIKCVLGMCNVCILIYQQSIGWLPNAH